MKKERLTRINEGLRREIGESLFRVMNEEAFDLAAVSITHVIVSSNLQHARVLVSIREHKEERAAMLALLAAHRADIQHEISKKLMLKYTPRLEFVLDTSIEEGDRILARLYQLDPANKIQNNPNAAEPPEESDEIR
jgi:ribosome-binding factor A